MLVPKNLQGKHLTDGWNGFMQKNVLNPAAAPSGFLKSFQNIFRGFRKYFAKRDEKHNP